MRPIRCDLHGRKFRGHGVTRIYRKIVFSFCACCWLSRPGDCERHMQRMAGARPRLPESLARYIAQIERGEVA